MNLGSFGMLLPFLRTFCVCCRPKFSNFLTVFTIGLSLARFWRAFRISGGFEHPKPPFGTPLITSPLFTIVDPQVLKPGFVEKTLGLRIRLFIFIYCLFIFIFIFTLRQAQQRSTGKRPFIFGRSALSHS